MDVNSNRYQYYLLFCAYNYHKTQHYPTSHNYTGLQQCLLSYWHIFSCILQGEWQIVGDQYSQMIFINIWISTLWRCVHAWWSHQRETFSMLLAFCAGNALVTGEFPSQSPVMQSCDVFFDLCLNKQLSKQPRRRWFKTTSHLWVILMCKCNQRWIWHFSVSQLYDVTGQPVLLCSNFRILD